MNTFNLSTTETGMLSQVRELDCSELEHVCGGGLTNSNSYSSNFQGGTDGYGGSRRNP